MCATTRCVVTNFFVKKYINIKIKCMLRVSNLKWFYNISNNHFTPRPTYAEITSNIPESWTNGCCNCQLIYYKYNDQIINTYSSHCNIPPYSNSSFNKFTLCTMSWWIPIFHIWNLGPSVKIEWPGQISLISLLKEK